MQVVLRCCVAAVQTPPTAAITTAVDSSGTKFTTAAYAYASTAKVRCDAQYMLLVSHMGLLLTVV